ncbi:MAG: hypothetical protein IJE07_02875 [Clostridia bacterium]|nr:hypothetical protein [Clostridia bacterium]
MGNFANTLFSVLLGWVQGAVAWLWGLMGADGAQGLMGWLLEHWLALAVGLCLLGLAVDAVVYVVRWQPYRMWRTFRRRAGTDEATQDGAEEDTLFPDEPLAPEPMQWLYANGGTAPVQEPQPAPQQEASPEPAHPVQRVIPARRRRTTDGNVEYVLPPGDDQPGYNRPYYPPQWRQGDQHDGGGQA